jgi:hypothetical protein
MYLQTGEDYSGVAVSPVSTAHAVRTQGISSLFFLVEVDTVFLHE